MNKNSIVVVGSSNTDMVVQADHLPAAGETILGGRFFMNAGGKGANQAVAAIRLGGNVSLIAKTGRDIFGEQAITLFKAEGINTSGMCTDPELPSGVALITVDSRAENCIVVAPGSNAALMPEDLNAARHLIEEARVLLVQLEIPIETVAHALHIAAAKGLRIILNPAPAQALPDELLRRVTVITPNETEAAIMTGVRITDLDSARQAAQKLHGKGIPTVIITLGSQGALLSENNEFILIPAATVQAVDTTAAGDIFNGALAVALAENQDMKDAVRFACAAASLSVTRLGAQASAPYRKEIQTG